MVRINSLWFWFYDGENHWSFALFQTMHLLGFRSERKVTPLFVVIEYTADCTVESTWLVQFICFTCWVCFVGITSRPFPTPPYCNVFPSLWYMNIACSFRQPLSNNNQFYKRFLFANCRVFPYFSQHEDGMGLIEDNEINNNTLAGVWITTGIKRHERISPHPLGYCIWVHNHIILSRTTPSIVVSFLSLACDLLLPVTAKKLDRSVEDKLLR